MKFESCKFTNVAEAFAAKAIRLFHACPTPPASKKIAMLLTGGRLDVFVYPAGSHADVLSLATYVHAEAGLVAEVAAVFSA